VSLLRFRAPPAWYINSSYAPKYKKCKTVWQQVNIIFLYFPLLHRVFAYTVTQSELAYANGDYHFPYLRLEILPTCLVSADINSLFGEQTTEATPQNIAAVCISEPIQQVESVGGHIGR
jgi:hypothetical protein